MIELKSTDYFKALSLLDQVKINTLFARAVLQKCVPGSVFVDTLDTPRTFYVVHPYGMSLLFGDAGNEEFNRSLYDYITNKTGTRKHAEWLQGDPSGAWSPLIDSMLAAHNSTLTGNGDESEGEDPRRIQRNTRVNFSFDREAYLAARERFFQQDADLVRTGKEQFQAQAGAVLPRYFWRDEEHFLTDGVGYSILEGGETASTAFAACRTEHELEIGIETAGAYRGKGYAFTVCSALIDYCLDQNLTPVWACRLENQGSYDLAQKLGFRPSITLPYYRLPESLD